MRHRTELHGGGGNPVPTVDYTVVLADLQRQRAELEAAIAAISRLAGLPTATETTAAVAETIPARRASKRAARATTVLTGDTARPTQAPQGTAARILSALKSGPSSSPAIAERVGLTSAGVLIHLRKLVEVGTVRKEGASNATRYHLA